MTTLRLTAACLSALVVAFAVPSSAEAFRFFRNRQPAQQYVQPQPAGAAPVQQYQAPRGQQRTWSMTNPGNTNSLSHPKWRADRKATGAAYLP